MKKFYLILSLAALTAGICFAIPGKSNAESSNNTAYPEKPNVTANSKVLVAYFSWPETDGVDASSGASRVWADGKIYGNTEYVAMQIAEKTGGDLFAIKTKKTYPTPHGSLIGEAKREAEAKERPEMISHIKNLKDYDVIFVGYPNWWYDLPMVIYAFFDEYDFSGKTIIPFVTHGGSRFSQSIETITGLEKKAKVIQGPAIAGRDVPESSKSIETWLSKQNLLRNK